MKRNVKEALNNSIFDILSDVVREVKIPAYVVGGFVRDYLLGIKNDDIDIVVEGSGIKFAQSFAEKIGGKVSFFENYGTAMVKYRDLEIEFVGARKEFYERGSRKPIVEEGTLYDDISRRDFTINAMAISLNDENYGCLIDYFNGFEDLQNKIIKTPLDPDITFSDDPLRMFRAVRFISKLPKFTLNQDAYDGIKRNKERSIILSRERITMEIDKILNAHAPLNSLTLLNDLGLWEYAFPNNPFSELNVNVINNISNKDIRWFFLGETYIGTFLSFTKTMKLPNSLGEKLERIGYTYYHFDKLQYPELSLVRKCLIKSKEEAFNAIYAVFRYNTLSNKIWERKDIWDWYECAMELFNENESFINFKLACDGNDIAEYADLQEGIELGNLISLIKEKVIKGELSNTVNSIYSFTKYNFYKKKYNF